MRKKAVLIFLIIIIFLLSAPSTLAWSYSDIPGFYGKTASEAGLTQADYAAIVANVITIILSIAGAIFVILFIYGGISWMTSTGSEDKIGKARKTLTYAVIGVAVVASAYAITTFVVSAIPTGKVTPDGAGGGDGGGGASGTGDTCTSQDGVCAAYEYCTRTLQGVSLGVSSDCGDQICCSQPTTTQNCDQCGKGITNVCDRGECYALGCSCEFKQLTFYCTYTPNYENGGSECTRGWGLIRLECRRMTN